MLDIPEALGWFYAARDMPTTTDHMLVVALRRTEEGQGKARAAAFFNREPGMSDEAWKSGAAAALVQTWNEQLIRIGPDVVVVCGGKTLEDAHELSAAVWSTAAPELHDAGGWFARYLHDAEGTIALVDPDQTYEVMGTLPDMRLEVATAGRRGGFDTEEEWISHFSPRDTPLWDRAELNAYWNDTSPRERSDRIRQVLDELSDTTNLASPAAVEKMQEISGFANQNIDGRDAVFRWCLDSQPRLDAALEVYRSAPQSERPSLSAAVGAACVLTGVSSQSAALVSAEAKNDRRQYALVSLAEALAKIEPNRDEAVAYMVKNYDREVDEQHHAWMRGHTTPQHETSTAMPPAVRNEADPPSLD